MARRAVCFGAKMTRSGSRRLSSAIAAALFGILLVITVCSAERAFPSSAFVLFNGQDSEESAILKELVTKAGQFIWQPHESEYQHIWPPMKFGWEIVLGTMIAFFGAAVGSVGGVGGGGIFVPMLTLIIGFDAKSSTAISKCMIMGAAGSTVYYNLKMKHPTLDLPIIDYDLAMVFQPMLMLGISIGVAFNVIFADWMVTVLLIILFIATSLKACFKGIETWKQETSQMKEKEEERSRKKPAESAFEEDNAVDFTALPGEPEPNVSEQTRNDSKRGDVADTVLLNIRLKELAMLLFVWFAFLVLQIAKTHSATCSTKYWVFNLLQVPVAFSVSLYEAVSLYRGTKVVASKGAAGVNWRIPQICLYLFCGIVAGVVGGLLGLGGGFILGPLLLELGIPPQVSSATATFVMMFSSSMSVVEYYFLKRFPVPYAAYLFVVCFIAALWGQHVIRKLVILLGRASLIIFTLAFVIFLSAITLGGVGIVRMITKIQKGEYMGFENLCTYDP